MSVIDEQDVRQPESVRASSSASVVTVAEAMSPLLDALFGRQCAIRFEFWDGSGFGPPSEAATGVVRMTSPNALRRLLWAPGELGLGRAYVAGELEADGDLFAIMSALRDMAVAPALSKAAIAKLTFSGVRKLGLLQPPLPPPPEEAKLSGVRHSLRRDSRAISHHYDVGNDFYRLVLGPTMTYSCARFTGPDTTLDDAQIAKYELICRKLGLHHLSEPRLLDVGCGWGSMSIHAATQHGARVVGITISPSQAKLARERVEAAGVSDRVEIRLQDYRELAGERFDAISSIGMSEHVGAERLAEYFTILRGVLEPTGRLLNHAISTVGGSKVPRNSFMGRYVFPDSELIDAGQVALVMEQAGFEVRDVESLREHYSKTLQGWVGNLEADWDRAVELVGLARARIWRLYITGAIIAFDDNRLGLHQVLGVVPTGTGFSGMPPTRRDWD